MIILSTSVMEFIRRMPDDTSASGGYVMNFFAITTKSISLAMTKAVTGNNKKVTI